MDGPGSPRGEAVSTIPPRSSLDADVLRPLTKPASQSPDPNEWVKLCACAFADAYIVHQETQAPEDSDRALDYLARYREAVRSRDAYAAPPAHPCSGYCSCDTPESGILGGQGRSPSELESDAKAWLVVTLVLLLLLGAGALAAWGLS